VSSSDAAPVPEVRHADLRSSTQLLILTVYGRYSSVVGGWMAVAHLIELLRRLGVEAHATRSAIVRMTRAGFLKPEPRGPVRGYAATTVAEAAFVQGDAAVESAVEHGPLQDGWTIVSFSIPESQRAKRYTLRKRLLWLGMGNLGSGLWIAPARALPQVMAWVRRLGFERHVDVFSAQYEGFDDVADLVRRSWDLEQLACSYRSYVEVWAPVVEHLRARAEEPEPGEAFATYTAALQHWIRFPFQDPGLPVELLPDGWRGAEADLLFRELRTRLEGAAFEFVASVVRS
jgi:phenylacetic acid degradation operon negative regulatory protein